MRDVLRVPLFAAVVGLVCSGLLVGATLYTAPFREANEKAEEVRNFLAALGVAVPDGSDSSTLLEIYQKNVEVQKTGTLETYRYVPAGAAEPKAVAVGFSGMGLWGPIKGVLALEPDLKTISGVRFYQQEETPGLGGEIGSEWFQKQFVGKRIVGVDETPGFRIVKPGAGSEVNAVDGISGATMTSQRVGKIIDDLAVVISQEAAGGQ